MSRVVLHWSETLTEPRTFFLLADRRTIRANLKEAESACHVVEFPVRFRQPFAGALKISPVDSDLNTWFVESAVLHRDLARLELQLSNMPAHAAWVLMEI